jgi:hypothetical protein
MPYSHDSRLYKTDANTKPGMGKKANSDDLMFLFLLLLMFY